MQSKSVSHTSLESAGIIALTLFLSLSAWARSETVLHNCAGGPDGAFPRASLIFDSAGHLYGTTQGGGAGDFGTVFKLAFTGTRWTERVLYRFTGGTDGSTPVGGVAMDKAGNLYGTTLYGGTYGYGTVFKLTASRPGWTETVLYSFKGSADGIYPFAGVTLDAAGNLYGTTYAGGLGRCSQENNGCGTVFELTNTGGWTHTILYLFP